MKLRLLAGLVALAPLVAAAAPLPYRECLPAQNGPVCPNAKPSLLGANLDCELCAPTAARATSVDQGKPLASFCDALRMISVLSPCDEMQHDVADVDRTTM